MKDLGAILEAERLGALRAAYDHDAMIGANVRAVARMVPRLGAWNEEIGRTFYGRSGPLAPADRERCLIALIGSTGPALPLAVHMYWALMEGVGVEEIVQIVGLAACYGGLRQLALGLEVLDRMLRLMNEMAAKSRRDPDAVLEALLRAFTPMPAH